jgi:hypothetical protein
MARVSFNFDYKVLDRKFFREAGKLRSVMDKAKTIADRNFRRIHQALMDDFDGHAITQELKAGPNPDENPSGTLGSMSGNLFSFLGFYAGTDPTKELRVLLNSIRLGRGSYLRGVISFDVKDIPTKNKIIGATRMVWGSGTSWAFAVETGKFNGDAALSHYIFETWAGSKSGTGIQLKGVKYTENKFVKKEYISEMLGKFKERVSNYQYRSRRV